jgi:hypothetical protein
VKKRNSSPVTAEQEAELVALAAMSGDKINTGDIPEQRDWSGARRGLFSARAKAVSKIWTVSDVEEKVIDKWLRTHRARCAVWHSQKDAARAQATNSYVPYVVVLRPTGIGLGVEVVCDCGASTDVTDIDSW